MLTVPAALFRKPRGRRGGASSPPPPPPSGGTVNVLGVTRFDATELDWEVDAETAMTTGSVNVQILYDGAWITMPFVGGAPGFTLAGYVDDTALATQWRVIDAQAGITPNLVYQSAGTIT